MPVYLKEDTNINIFDEGSPYTHSPTFEKSHKEISSFANVLIMNKEERIKVGESLLNEIKERTKEVRSEVIKLGNDEEENNFNM